MHQMREHGTPGHRPCRAACRRLDRPFSSRPGSSGRRGYMDRLGKCKRRVDRATPHALAARLAHRMFTSDGLRRTRPRASAGNSIRPRGAALSTPSARNAVADFPRLLLARNSQITCGLLYRSSEARTGEQQEGAMRVRVATGGRLLGLDTGDWSTLIAGSMLAG